ncbi:MAG: ABC transporter permease [Acidobacteriota bacterium]
MNAFLAVFDRELRAYVVSPIAWVVLAFLLFVQGGLFVMIVGFLTDPAAVPGVTPFEIFFSNIVYWLVLVSVTPILTMRLLSEERRSGTLESLMTAPITAAQVVLAKFFAALAFWIFLWLPTLAYPAMLERHLDLDWGPIAAGYLATVSIGALFLAVGLFASVWARNQIVAAVIAFGLIVMLWIGPWAGDLVRDETVRSVLGYANLVAHSEELAKGIVDTRRLVYYLSTTAVFLLFTVRALDARRGS